jgi:acetylornithine deacetylase
VTATAEATDIVALTRALVDIDSTTGREGAAARWLADYLRAHGWSVLEQRVDATRFNVIATPAGDATGAVTLSTHIDCVPPFFPSRLEGDRLYGRGACDAKGILAATCAAAEHASRFLIDGEPTDNRLGLATRGILRLKLRATGRAAHSSFPELGESAIDKLIDSLVALRGVSLPDDPVLGRTHYTVGLITGGVAPNVVSPSADAEVMFRTVSDAADVRRAISALEPRIAIEHVLEVPPVRLTTVPGFDAAVFPYTTDIPFLPRWGAPLLFGPGSIHVAHTADEYVSVAELHAAADHYVTLARALLAISS